MAAQATRKDLVITRVFGAPVALVWGAWTDPEHLTQWHGPKDFTCPAYTVDLRVGGRYHGCMRGADGKDYWSTGTYREIVPLRKLVCTDSFADAEGNVVPGSHYGLPEDFPLEMLVTVTFEERDGKTTMTLVHAGLPAGEIGEMTGAGWRESFDKLAKTL